MTGQSLTKSLVSNSAQSVPELSDLTVLDYVTGVCSRGTRRCEDGETHVRYLHGS